MSKRYPLTGIASNVEFGKAGARIRDVAGKLQARDNADTVFANMQGADALALDDLVTLRQLQSSLNGLSWKEPVELATVANVTLSGEQTIDGVLTSTSRILVKNQTTASENGIYNTAAGAWTRATDMAVGDDAASDAMFVQQGTVNADLAYTCTDDTGSAVVGTDDLTFVNFASVVSGVTSLADAVGITGIATLDNGAAPVPTLRAVLGESGVLTAALVGTDIVVSINALGVTTGKIADDAVTEAKVAPLDGTFHRRVAFGFADAGTNVNIGAALPANAIVTETKVLIGTAFDAQADMSVGTVATPALLLRTADIAEEVADLYIGDSLETGAASTQLIIQVGASAATAGSGFVDVEYIVSA